MYIIPSFLVEKVLAFGGAIPGSLPGGTDFRAGIVGILDTVLNLLGLLAAIIIVMAGIRLISSQGEDAAKEKAKNTIFYAAIGLLVVLFAKAIVTLVTTVPFF